MSHRRDFCLCFCVKLIVRGEEKIKRARILATPCISDPSLPKHSWRILVCAEIAGGH